MHPRAWVQELAHHGGGRRSSGRPSAWETAHKNSGRGSPGAQGQDKQAVKPKIVTPWVVSGKVHGAFEILGG